MLKLQYFGHLMQKANSLEKTLILEKIEHKRRSRLEEELMNLVLTMLPHACKTVKERGVS